MLGDIKMVKVRDENGVKEYSEDEFFDKFITLR